MAERRRRVAWFADLEALVQRIEVLEELRDEIGLTTVAPESRLSHTSGFAASPDVAAASPLADWRDRPGLRQHREGFGVPEPAMGVLPGVLGGVDDTPVLRVIDECRRLGIEVWGHAGLWSYGGEVFPEYAAVDLWGRPLVPDSLPWGTMFCPNKADLNSWIARSLADVASRYDLDGWFLDHARFTSPGHAPTLLACGCADCGTAAEAYGVDFDAVRQDLGGLRDDLRATDGDALLALARGGAVAVAGWLDRRPGVLAWFTLRARMLADRFGELHAAIGAASPRHVEFGSDVFPPGVGLLGGHLYGSWADAGATYLTGGFGPKIGWGSVRRVTAASLGTALASLMPQVSDALGAAIVDALVGGSGSTAPEGDLDAYLMELQRMAVARGELPVYPPVAGPPEPETLARMLHGIVDSGLDGVMLAGLEATSPEQRQVIARDLSARIL